MRLRFLCGYFRNDCLIRGWTLAADRFDDLDDQPRDHDVCYADPKYVSPPEFLEDTAHMLLVMATTERQMYQIREENRHQQTLLLLCISKSQSGGIHCTPP